MPQTGPTDALRQLWQRQALDDGWTMYKGHESDDPEWHLYGGYFAWARHDIYRARDILERVLMTADAGPLYLKQRLRYALAEVYRCIGDLHLAGQFLHTLLAEAVFHPRWQG
ncbi:MAG TPA: hypothetical protein VGK74_11560 [Symbiobacteriaceae bacterium]